MPYTVELLGPARRALDSLERRTFFITTRALHRLEDNPRPHGVVKLKGSDLWRIRVGDYRAVYHIDDDHMLVTVLRVGHRREVYR